MPYLKGMQHLSDMADRRGAGQDPQGPDSLHHSTYARTRPRLGDPEKVLECEALRP